MPPRSLLLPWLNFPITHIHNTPFILEEAHFGLFKKEEGDRNGTFSSDIRTVGGATGIVTPAWLLPKTITKILKPTRLRKRLR